MSPAKTQISLADLSLRCGTGHFVVVQLVNSCNIIFSVEDVAQTFLELAEKDNCNGDVVTVDKLRGRLYHYNKHKNRL